MYERISEAVVDAAKDVFDLMLGCEVHVDQPRAKEGTHAQYDMTGVVTFTGRSEGMVALSISREIVNRASEAMIGVGVESEEELTDIVAELTNMVAGKAKANLDECGLSLSIPTVVSGNGIVSCGSRLSTVVIPLRSDWGAFCVEVALSAVSLPV